MSFHHEEKFINPSTLCITVAGALDAGTALTLEMATAEHIQNAAVKTIILNVPDLTFISSSGLRVMMIFIKALTPRQGKFYLAGANPQVAGLVKMSAMGKWVHMVGAVEDCK